jgi:hypothetical protein
VPEIAHAHGFSPIRLIYLPATPKNDAMSFFTYQLIHGGVRGARTWSVPTVERRGT